MPYKVEVEKKAAKSLENINEPDYSRLKKAILDLRNDPRPIGFRKLKGRKGFRIREGDYRIIYDIFDKILRVNVVTVGHRKDVYKKQ
jgi:mRNA interferase RelE/StbE